MNEVKIPDALYNEVIDYLAEELFSSWHPEKPEGCQLALNPNYEHDKMLEHYAKYGAGLEIASIVTGAGVEEVTADVRSAYRKYYQKKGNETNEVKISDELYDEVIDYLAEELFSAWHPEKPDGLQLALDPDYEHDKMIEHYAKYRGGVDVLNIVTGDMIHDIEADACALARRYERERAIG